MSQEQQPQAVLKAASIIQRDAIMSALREAGIDAQTAPRDISRKITENTMDLAYEGYSALFDGFAIQVDPNKFEQAKKIAEALVEKARKTKEDPVLAKGHSMRKFHFCCLFSISLPIVFHFLAAYHLVTAIQSGEKFSPIYVGISLAFALVTAVLSIWLFTTFNWIDFFRSLAQTL